MTSDKPETHTYNTTTVVGQHLDVTDVLVGESGGLSAIYGRARYGLVPGVFHIETEHGMLLIDPDKEYVVYAD